MTSVSTTTQLLLLQQKIDSFDWIITETTLTLTFLIALFVAIQFVYSRKLQVKDIEKLKLNLTNFITNKVDDKALDLQSLIRQTTEELRSNIKEDQITLTAEISRSYALHNEQLGAFENAFEWWLKAARFYKESKEEDLFRISFDSALDSITKLDITNKGALKLLLKHMPVIEGYLNFLRPFNKIEIEILEKKLKEKLETL